jgi:hypothetical protein
MNKISQCGSVERTYERAQRFPKDTFEFTNGNDRTGVRTGFEALDDLQIRFDMTKDISKQDPIWFACQRHATGAARDHFDVTVLTQRLYNSHEMMA